MANVGAFFKKTLPNIALTVASGVPGPIGMVATLIGGVLGKTVEPTAGGINTAVEGASPDKLVELQEKDLEYKELNAKLGIDEELVQARLAEQDRESARARQIAVKDWTLPALAWVIVAAGFTLIASVLFGWSRVDSVLAGTLIGYIVAMLQQVIGYYFGSSSGSAAKTTILANQSNGGK